MKVQRGRETLQLYPLTPGEYFNLRAGDEVYDAGGARHKVTSIKKWAGRPGELVINLKHGLYDFSNVDLRARHPDVPLFRTSRSQFKAPKGLQGFPVKIGDKLITREPITFGKSRVEEGAVGELKGVHPLTAEQSKLYHGGQRALLTVKFVKGGTFFNVYPRQVKKVAPRLSR